MKITALDRGLRILDYIISSGGSRRYVQIKENTGNLTDASLNRLLKSLLASSVLAKNENGHYEITDNVRRWKNFLEGSVNLRQIVEPLIRQLTEEINESAGCVAYTSGAIKMIYSRNVAESVAVISAGTILPFQTDHAASLAVMELMTDKERAAAIKSENSQIGSMKAYTAGLRDVRFGNCMLDHSQLRPGISRLAIGVPSADATLAFFVCSTTPVAEAKKDEFASILGRYKMELLERLDR